MIQITRKDQKLPRTINLKINNYPINIHHWTPLEKDWIISTNMRDDIYSGLILRSDKKIPKLCFHHFILDEHTVLIPFKNDIKGKSIENLQRYIITSNTFKGHSLVFLKDYKLQKNNVDDRIFQYALFLQDMFNIVKRQKNLKIKPVKIVEQTYKEFINSEEINDL